MIEKIDQLKQGLSIEHEWKNIEDPKMLESIERCKSRIRSFLREEGLDPESLDSVKIVQRTSDAFYIYTNSQGQREKKQAYSFYDPFSHHVVLSDNVLKNKTEDEREVIISHEIQHALGVRVFEEGQFKKSGVLEMSENGEVRNLELNEAFVEFFNRMSLLHSGEQEKFTLAENGTAGYVKEVRNLRGFILYLQTKEEKVDFIIEDMKKIYYKGDEERKRVFLKKYNEYVERN